MKMDTSDQIIINSQIKLYDAYISYSRSDGEYLAKGLCKALQERNISVWTDDEYLRVGNFVPQITQAISKSRLFVAIISEGALSSEWILHEIEYAMSEANDRGKSIVPIIMAPLDFSSPKIPFQLKLWNGFTFKSNSGLSIEFIADSIAKMLNAQEASADIHEKLANYINTGLNDKATSCLCELCLHLCDKIMENSNDEQENAYLTFLSYLEKLSDLYDYTYGSYGRELAHKKLNVLSRIDRLLNTDFFRTKDIYRLSIALRLQYLDREIRLDCADAITGGDVSQGIVHTLPENDYAEKQKEFADKYDEQIKNLTALDSVSISSDRKTFVEETRNYIYRHNKKHKENPKVAIKSNPDDELLCSVASFTREGNKLFDIISERQPAGDFLQCLLMSYERLKAYCEVIGEKNICAECIDRITELKRKISKPTKESPVSEKLEKSIKTLLGLTIPKSGQYDLFISHKREDYDIALDIYQFVRKNLKEPFFDSVTLPELSEAQYRKSIMQALDVSRHFVVVFSDLEYLKSDWVSLEMDIFQSEKDEGRKPNSNFLMIATGKVYKKIMASNKMLLPIEYRRCEIISYDEYKNALLNYLNR